MKTAPILALATLTLACSSGGSGGTDCAECDVPANRSDLEAFLAAGSYRSFAQESGPHPSDGPHFGDVITYLSPKLTTSLEAGNSTHPIGAAAVKELLGRDGDDVNGFTVWVKVADDGGDGFYWYEEFDGSNFANGRGTSICVGCHQGSQRDFLLTDFPLR